MSETDTLSGHIGSFDVYADNAAGHIHSNSQGYVVKPTLENSYDWLYALRGDDREYLVRACLSRRRSVTLCAKYELGAVAESG